MLADGRILEPRRLDGAGVPGLPRVHVVAGLTAVITGATAALSAKGSSRHVRAGRLYYWAITVLFTTALILAAMRPREDWHLALIGTVAFTAAFLGVRHRRLRRSGDAGHIVGMGVSFAAMLTAFYVDNGPTCRCGITCRRSPSTCCQASSRLR